MLKKLFISSLFLFFYSTKFYKQQVIASSAAGLTEIEKITEKTSCKSKKPKIEDTIINEIASNERNFNLSYCRVKVLLGKHKSQGTSLCLAKIEPLDSFLNEIGKKLADRLIDRLIAEEGCKSLEGHFQFVDKFLEERSKEIYTVDHLEDFGPSLSQGYKRFSYKPKTDDLGGVLIHLSICKWHIFSEWNFDEKGSFTFEIPFPLTGTAEPRQFSSFKELPSQLNFSSDCLDLSYTTLDNGCLEEIAGLYDEFRKKFNELKFNYTNLTDATFQKLYPLIFNGRFLSLSFDGNQLTSVGLEWLLKHLQDRREHERGSSALFLRRNRISNLEKLKVVFTKTLAPKRKDLHSEDSPSKYPYIDSVLQVLDLSENPLGEDEVIQLLRTFSSFSNPSSFPLFFSRTRVILKGIASIQDQQQSIEDFLQKNKIEPTVVLDDDFMPLNTQIESKDLKLYF